MDHPPASNNLILRQERLSLQDLPDASSPWPSEPAWTGVYTRPQAPGIWVGRLTQWHRDPAPSGSAWYCFDDINPRSLQPFTALRAQENDPLGDTLLSRNGHDLGWHYLLGVERDRLRPGLVWSMALPLQQVVDGPHRGEWVRLMRREPGGLRARSYTESGHLNTLWDARVTGLSNVFDDAGAHHLALRLTDDLGESVVHLPPPMAVDLMLQLPEVWPMPHPMADVRTHEIHPGA